MRQWIFVRQKSETSLTTAFLAVIIALASLAPLQASAQNAQTTFDPSTFLTSSNVRDTFRQAQAQALNVLDYLRKNVTHETLADLEDELPKYNRREHFYGWVNADPTTNCLDTRTEVLVRDADPNVQIVFKNSKQCNVARGLWHDPYTGEDFKISTAIQIDHVVPLKNAYLTGAAHWTTSKRCNYGNFLNNDFHLLAVSGHENMSKGGKSPEAYMPPDESYACEYVAKWMKIKAIWKLQATEEEMNGIENVIQTYHCSTTRFQIPAARVQADRQATLQPPKRCAELDEASNL